MKKVLALILALAMFPVSCITDGVTIPDVTIKQFEIPDGEAMNFARNIKTGWVLGNTFDAYDNGWMRNDPLAAETYWVNVKTTEKLIDSVYNAGFNAIRIPVSWHDHVDENFTVNEVWMNRVKEVAGWALDRGMYVIVNVHHDNAPDLSEFNSKKNGTACFYPDSEHYGQSAKYLTAIWSQMAEAFKDCDEHLILESMNEPRLTGTNYEWNFDKNSPVCLDAMDCINRLNQLFVDTVRASGGNNATRYLMVPSYDANPEYACNDYFKFPTDTNEVSHIILEAHAYTPYNFALNTTGTNQFSVNNSKDKSDIGMFMNNLYNKYIANGIPVFIDEYGAVNKNNPQQRVDFAAYYIASARARGIGCFWWDNGAFSGNGENFGLIERKTSVWMFKDVVDAIMKYS